MNWKELNSEKQIDEIKKDSFNKPVIIFKHSTRCAISSLALDRLENGSKNGIEEEFTPYFLDLIRYRHLSDQVAEEFDVYHESPQLIMLKDGKAVYHNSHLGISYDDVLSRL